MNSFMIDGAGHANADLAVCIIVTLSSFISYARAAFERRKAFIFLRWVIGFGFGLWGLRLWHAVLAGNDVIIAPISLIAISMVTGGYCAVQLLSIRRIMQTRKIEIACLLDPSQRCHREDLTRNQLHFGQNR